MVIAIVILLFNLQENTEALRIKLDKAANSREATEKLHQELMTKSNITPLEEAYLGTVEMLLADQSFLPWNKYNYFKSGALHLDNAVRNAPDNVEIRFLRFACQDKAPSFLKYSAHIDADKALLIHAYPTLTDQDLKNRMARHLKTSIHITSKEKEVLR